MANTKRCHFVKSANKVVNEIALIEGLLVKKKEEDTFKLFVCVRSVHVLSDVGKTGETDFVEKPKSIGKLAVPKKMTK